MIAINRLGPFRVVLLDYGIGIMHGFVPTEVRSPKVLNKTGKVKVYTYTIRDIFGFVQRPQHNAWFKHVGSIPGIRCAHEAELAERRGGGGGLTMELSRGQRSWPAAGLKMGATKTQ